MDFLFKAVFSGGDDDEARGAPAVSCSGAGAWGGGFGGLVRTLASRSESAIQTCRRDLGEFGTGLLTETAALREALRDLPSSLGPGASVARESPESAGPAVDGSVRRGADEGEKAGDATVNLVVKRVIASREEGGEEEDLSWEVDDDDNATEEQKGRKQRVVQLGVARERGEEEEQEGAMIGGYPVENSQELGNMADQILLEGRQGRLWLAARIVMMLRPCQAGHLFHRKMILGGLRLGILGTMMRERVVFLVAVPTKLICSRR